MNCKLESSVTVAYINEYNSITLTLFIISGSERQFSEVTNRSDLIGFQIGSQYIMNLKNNNHITMHDIISSFMFGLNVSRFCKLLL